MVTLQIHRPGTSVLTDYEDFATYHEAILCGQRVAGRGHFHVHVPLSRVPSREEQLLLPPVKRTGIARRAALDRWLDKI